MNQDPMMNAPFQKQLLQKRLLPPFEMRRPIPVMFKSISDKLANGETNYSRPLTEPKFANYLGGSKNFNERTGRYVFQ